MNDNEPIDVDIYLKHILKCSRCGTTENLCILLGKKIKNRYYPFVLCCNNCADIIEKERTSNESQG